MSKIVNFNKNKIFMLKKAHIKFNKNKNKNKNRSSSSINKFWNPIINSLLKKKEKKNKKYKNKVLQINNIVSRNWSTYFFSSINIIYNYINVINNLNLYYLYMSKQEDINNFFNFILNQDKVNDMEYSYWYFLNANISVALNDSVKRYNMLEVVRQVLVFRSIKAVVPFFGHVISFKYRKSFYKFFKSWYMSINRGEPATYNLNNLVVYSSELLNFLQYNPNLKDKITHKLFNKFIWIYKKFINIKNVLNYKYCKFSFFLIKIKL